MSDYTDLIKEMETSPSLRRMSRLESLLRSYELFGRNFAELRNALLLLSDPKHSSEFWALRNKWRLGEMMTHISRLIHNWVASALSLRDHTFVLKKRLAEDDIALPDYESEIATRFTNDPLTQFVFGLRQYVQHYSLPPITSYLDFNTGKTTLVLNSKALLRFDGWNGTGKAFIAEKGDRVEVLPCIDNYHNHIASFMMWYEKAYRDTLAEDAKIVDSFNTRLQTNWVNRMMCPENLIWPSEDKHSLTLREAEEIFAAALDQHNWRKIDLLPQEPMVRCEAILQMFREAGITDDQLFSRARLAFSKVGAQSGTHS